MAAGFTKEKTSDRVTRRAVIVIGLALAILGGTISLSSYNLREKSRNQLTYQNAQIVYQLWLNQEFSDETDGQLGVTARPGDLLWTTLKAAQLPQLAGLYGTRLFNAEGSLLLTDPNVSDGTLSTEDLAQLSHLKPVAHFRSQVDLSEVDFSLTETAPKKEPLLEICIPLHGQHKPELLGVAQFILDGKAIAAQFRMLDRNLIWQATATFVAGGGLLILLLGASFRQLLRLNQLLSERTLRLLKANQELALAAKTSAVGAVSAHLIHGLKNPLSGLQSFVASRGSSGSNEGESDWQLAASTTRRMQNMIAEIVRVLRDEQGESSYELTLEEFFGALAAKVDALSKEAGIRFAYQVTAEATLTNREANLLSLILYNLIQNAIQATGSGKAVTLKVSAIDDKIVCAIQDQGPGIPAHLQTGLFQPCQSTKEGGSGIGLAISKQLANCLEADLELQETSPDGSRFVLRFGLKTAVGQGTLYSANAHRS